MPEFEVRFSGHSTIVADDLAHAVKVWDAINGNIKAAHGVWVGPDRFTECSSANAPADVIGICECCGYPVFEDEEYGVGEDIIAHEHCEPRDY
jgi:hypothetical protein